MINSAFLHAQNDYNILRLDFNTKAKELAPAFYRDGLVFCSDRRHDFITSYTTEDGNPLTNLYYSEINKHGKFENPGLISRELTTFLFDGPSVFTHDGNVIYYTRTIDVSSSKKNRNRQDTTFGIFMSSYINGSWTNPVAFNFNSREYNTGYPFISADGSQLFFCSDAPGGMGGLDIYVSSFHDGIWGEPKNLGQSVNTSKNEVFPFLHKDGRLFFSSRGFNNQGDLDIYYAVVRDGEWQKPVRLKEPFNTDRDDYGLILNASADTGYFVSDRDGSADIFGAYSGMPVFTNCPTQKENDYCYVFYESNNNELDTTAFAYEWDLGDGTKIRALEAEHCYAKPDTYQVQLNIIDKLTREVLLSQATYSFEVEKIEQPYITATDTSYSGMEIVVNGNETYLKNLAIENYYWDFGDGTRAEGILARHSYLFPGTYNIILGVTGINDTTESGKDYCVVRQIVILDNKKR